MCLKGSATISIHEERLPVKFLKQVESKTNQFENVFKLLARFSTQFRVKESFKLYLLYKLRKFGDKSRNNFGNKNNFKF